MWSGLANQMLSFTQNLESEANNTDKKGQFRINFSGGGKECPVDVTSKPDFSCSKILQA